MKFNVGMVFICALLAFLVTPKAIFADLILTGLAPDKFGNIYDLGAYTGNEVYQLTTCPYSNAGVEGKTSGIAYTTIGQPGYIGPSAASGLFTSTSNNITWFDGQDAYEHDLTALTANVAYLKVSTDSVFELESSHFGDNRADNENQTQVLVSDLTTFTDLASYIGSTPVTLKFTGEFVAGDLYRVIVDHSYRHTGTTYLNPGAGGGYVILTVSPVPEPSSLALLGLGGIGFAFVVCWRRRMAAS